VQSPRIFDALPEQGYRLNDPATGSAVEAINRARCDERLSDLEALRDEVLSANSRLDVDVLVETGSEALTAIRSVLRNQHDLIMKAAEGGSGTLKPEGLEAPCSTVARLGSSDVSSEIRGPHRLRISYTY